MMIHEKAIDEINAMDLSADRLPAEHPSLCSLGIRVVLRLASSD
jgi:hypothetical protein